MSGTDTNDFAAPTRLTTIVGDQPIGNATDGSLVMPSMYFLQMLQRVLSYIGQPAEGTSGQTLTDQVVVAFETAQTALAMATGAENIAISVADSLAAGTQALTLASAPPSVGLTQAPASAPPFVGLTQSQVFARIAFGGL
jgi:hypothetical protein